MDSQNGSPGVAEDAAAVTVEPLAAPDGAPDLFRPYLLEDARADALAAGAGFSTGFSALDDMDFRFRPGKLYAVIGRPSEGKTTFLLEALMRHVHARRSGEAPEDMRARGPAVFVTYEENRHDLYLRLLLRECALETAENDHPGSAPYRADAERWLRTGAPRPGADASNLADSLERAGGRLDEYGRDGLLVLLDGDRDGGDVAELLAGLRDGQRARGTPPSLLVVDYFQKIRAPEYLRGGSRQEQLQETADLLRGYAKGDEADTERPEYAVPVLVGAQVNREPASGKEPIQPELHHVREADDLANDAAGVLSLHRPEANGEDGQPLKVKILKNRDGRRGRDFELGFYGSCSHVADAPEAGSWSLK